MKLALVRAGAAELGERLVGDALVPLSAEGEARARAAAGLIRAKGEVSRIYAPPSGHAADAARVLAEALGGPGVSTAELGELHLGLWQGLGEAELDRRHKTAFRAFRTDARAVVPPDGEEVDAARERLGRALAKIRRRHRRDARWVPVVAPEFAFALLVAAAEGREAPAQLWRARSEGADVRFLEVE